MSISYFNQGSVADGTGVISYIHKADIVSAIQADSPDTYLDSTSELNKVFVYYRDSGHRQDVRIVHTGTNLSGNASWSSGARDGTWEKYHIIAFDSNGARHDLGRTAIGTAEDIVHSSGTMTLNT